MLIIGLAEPLARKTQYLISCKDSEKWLAVPCSRSIDVVKFFINFTVTGLHVNRTMNAADICKIRIKIFYTVVHYY
jgi:hypothetical protein